MELTPLYLPPTIAVLAAALCLLPQSQAPSRISASETELRNATLPESERKKIVPSLDGMRVVIKTHMRAYPRFLAILLGLNLVAIALWILAIRFNPTLESIQPGWIVATIVPFFMPMLLILILRFNGLPRTITIDRLQRNITVATPLRQRTFSFDDVQALRLHCKTITSRGRRGIRYLHRALLIVTTSSGTVTIPIYRDSLNWSKLDASACAKVGAAWGNELGKSLHLPVEYPGTSFS